MVTPLSNGGGLRALLLLEAVLVSGLLVVTKFLDFSDAVLMVGFAFSALTAAGLLCTTGFAGAVLAATAGLTTFLTGSAFFSGGFFTGACARTGLEAGFVAIFFAGAAFAGATFAFGTGLTGALRDTPATTRTTGFARAGAFAALARLPAFCLLFAIPEPIL